MALCSLSTGRMETPYSFASGIIRCPAVTSVSLLASAIVFFARIAATVGRRPIIPTTAVTSISDSGITAAASRPSIPLTICTGRSRTFARSCAASASSQTAASFGRNSRIWRSRRRIFLPAVSAQTLISFCSLTISSVCVPIEPVEPRIAICFIFSNLSQAPHILSYNR